MSVYVSLAVAIVGLLVYGFSANSKAAEAGRIAYMVGLFVFLFQVVGAHVITPLR